MTCTCKKKKLLASVQIAGSGAAKQPADFLLCAFGAQIQTRKKLPPYDPIEIQIHLPAVGRKKARDVICSGVTIESMPSNRKGYYCSFLKFVSIPKAVQKDLGCGTAHDKNAMLCNFCAGLVGEAK